MTTKDMEFIKSELQKAKHFNIVTVRSNKDGTEKLGTYKEFNGIDGKLKDLDSDDIKSISMVVKKNSDLYDVLSKYGLYVVGSTFENSKVVGNPDNLLGDEWAGNARGGDDDFVIAIAAEHPKANYWPDGKKDAYTKDAKEIFNVITIHAIETLGKEENKFRKAADTLKHKGQITNILIRDAVRPIYKKPAVKKLNNKKARIYLRALLFTVGFGAMLGIMDSSKLAKDGVRALKQEMAKPAAEKDKVLIMSLMIAIGALVAMNISAIAAAKNAIDLHQLNMEDIEDKLWHAEDGADVLDKDSYIYKLLADMNLTQLSDLGDDFKRRCVTMFGLIETYMTDLEYDTFTRYLVDEIRAMNKISKQRDRKDRASGMIAKVSDVLTSVIDRNPGLDEVLRQISTGKDFAPLDFNQEVAKYNLKQNNER